MKLQTLKPRLAKAPGLQVQQLSSGTERIRGSMLQTIRERWFRRFPLCVHCEAKGIVTAATELDHITELADGGADADPNRQGLCGPCHRAKTDAARAARAKARGGFV